MESDTVAEINSNTPSKTTFTSDFATHAEWVQHCEDIYKEKIPPNPTYHWLKEDIFWPTLPDHHHIKCLKMRFTSRSQENTQTSSVELGVGLIGTKKGGKELKVFLPVAIQVSVAVTRRELT